jgi:hypothetical protein
LAINSNILVGQDGNISAKDKKSMDAVTAAHKSLGGPKLDSMKSVVLKGSYVSGIFETRASTSKTTKIGETLCELEIRILFPDDFIQIRRCPDWNGGTAVYYGISSGNVFNIFTTLQDAVRSRMTTDASTALDEWNRLLVGMIMKSISTSLILSTGSTEDFIVERKNGLLGTMVFDAKEKWPVKIDYKITTQVPVLSKDSGGRMVYAGDSKSEERSSYIQFSDRFSVDGMMFPKTITRVTSGEVEMTMTINDVKINPSLSKKDFDIPAKFAK